VIALDTSYLVALAIREHPAHDASLRIFDDLIRGGTSTMALAPQALAEFCHVVTDPLRFERPLDMAEALELSELWWHSQECRHATVDREVGALFLTWMHMFRLGRKRLLDTLLAATYHRAGVVRLASTDWREFERYGVFEVVRLG
jgi:predicted nucleic acid-binding protein